MREHRFICCVLLLSFVVLFSSSLVAQKTDIRVDGQNIKNLIAYMAQDKYLGRKPLTPEFNELCHWAAGNFARWGLEPAGDNGTFFQAVPISGRRGTYAFSTGIPRIKIDGREFFARYGDFTVDHRSTTGKQFTGEIVFVGYGIASSEKGLDEYKGIDVKNKFVLVFKGSPAKVEAPPGLFLPGLATADSIEQWESESEDSTKIWVAYQKGAAGILFYNPEPEENGFRLRRESIEKPSFTREFIIVSDLSERVFQWIMWKDDQESSRGFQNRVLGIRLDIKQKKAHSFNTKIKTEIKGFDRTNYYGEKFGNHKCKNVIAKITGSDPDLKNEYIVLGGHFDHLGVRNGQVYNGADDDASGSAVVMEVARLMKANNIQPKRTVLFCLWTGEELGLIGSRYWVEHPTDGITMDQVVVNFNMDMVGLGDKIGASGALNFPSIWEVIAKYQDQDILDVLEPRTGGPGGSDHSGFIELGIESVFLITRGGIGHPDYHDTGDDVEKINPDILHKTGKFVLQGTINAANEPKSLVIAERQHLYDGLRWNITAINPELKDRGGWSVLEANSQVDLADLIIDRYQDLQTREPQRPQIRSFRRGARRSNLSLGANGAEVFEHDLEFLTVAHKILSFGRIDVKGDDSVWFDRGLTESGRLALKAIEDSSIALCLIHPSRETFYDVLQTATKPFIVSGMLEFDSMQVAQINEKKVLVAVDFDPKDVDGCFSNLLKMKDQFADTDNLIINLIATENLDDAKQQLYLKLIKAGWSKNEIYAIGGSGTGRGSMGNFDRFVRRSDRAGGEFFR